MSNRTLLRAAVRERALAGAAVQEHITNCLPGEVTLHRNALEEWTVTSVDTEKRSDPDDATYLFRVHLKPPRGSYRWGYVGVDQLNEIKGLLECDYVIAHPVRRDGTYETHIEYIATWSSRGEP